MESAKFENKPIVGFERIRFYYVMAPGVVVTLIPLPPVSINKKSVPLLV
jgi:hypothetical protein